MSTWHDYEQRYPLSRRPDDWRDRPDGPDQLDHAVADFRAHGVITTRAEIQAAMNPPTPAPDLDWRRGMHIVDPERDLAEADRCGRNWRETADYWVRVCDRPGSYVV